MPYYLPEDYNSREQPSHSDQRGARASKQAEVYRAASTAAKAYGLRTILDVGCGSGFKHRFLRGFDIVGTEIEPTYSWLLETHPGRQWIKSNWADGPLFHGEFDLAICADVIEHLPGSGVSDLLTYLQQLAPQILIISTPVRQSFRRKGPPKNKDHVQEWAVEEFHHLISDYFEVLSHVHRDRHQYIVARGRTSAPHVISTMTVTTRVGCRTMCDYCPQTVFTQNYASDTQVMSLETFKTCVGKLPVSTQISFNGMSEPWLNPECSAMMRYAHQRGHRIKVSTMLTGMTEEDVIAIQDIPIRKGFMVHLPCEDGYESVKVDSSYLSLLQKLIDSRDDVSFHCMGTSIAPELEQLIGVENCEFKRINRRAGHVGAKERKPREGILRCRREFKSPVLLPDGRVLLCCMDFGLDHVLGNLLTSSPQELYSGPEFYRVVTGLQTEVPDILCRKCTNGCTRKQDA